MNIKKLVSLSIIISCALISSVMFLNCSALSPAQIENQLDLSSESADPIDPLDEITDPVLKDLPGVTLYETHCSSCHGTFTQSEKLGREKMELLNSLNLSITNIPSMKYLSILTDDEKNKIVEALTYEKSVATEAKILTVKPNVGNRYFMKSNLTELFVTDGTKDSSDTSIETIINKYITERPEAFGGSCSRYDDSCMTTTCGASGETACLGRLDIRMNAEVNVTLSTISQGYAIQACEEILAVTKSVTTVLVKTGLTTASPVNEANVTILAEYIYRDKPITKTAVDEIIKLGNTAKSLGNSVENQWRYILLPLCVSSSMDLL